jgi:4-amino-4-deoxy-L-arabinose transferase-like glycosyltransferase
VLAAGVTIWAQLTVEGRFNDFYNWVPTWTIVAVVAGLALLALALWQKRVPASLGLAVVVAGLLLLPAEWSHYETAHAALNTTLPQAGPRQGVSGASFGSSLFDTGTMELAGWLKQHEEAGTTWDLAVTSAQNASTLIADYDVPVLALGGFSGSDPTITVQQFADLVGQGKVRYVLTGGGIGGFVGGPGGGFGVPGGAFGATNSTDARGANVVMSAVQAVCTQVPSSSAPAQYRGSLYDCAGKADALAAR